MLCLQGRRFRRGIAVRATCRSTATTSRSNVDGRSDREGWAFDPRRPLLRTGPNVRTGHPPEIAGAEAKMDLAKNGHNSERGNPTVERRAIAAAKRGEWDAIHYLYVRYADDVLAYVRSILGDHHAAEDVTQNVFAKLMGAIQRYEERGAIPFAGWIMRVARNAALDYLRARRQIPVEEVRAAD